MTLFFSFPFTTMEDQQMPASFREKENGKQKKVGGGEGGCG